MPELKKTINRPQTKFPMKANLVQNEAASQKRWDTLKLYDRLREKRADSDPYVFHDGPPYANGDIHLGHLLNKCLKDFVVRTRTMMGKNCPYTPGWDCHGLPIEHKVMQELGEAAKEMAPIDIRRKCKKYAEKYVKTQSKQLQKLLTLADYDDPYLTMLPRYEAGVLEVFAGMVEKGLVYRDLKPVHWSIDNQTALAEAELEYYDREDTSVYVKFDLVDRDESLMIWTTTPWTLPANLAIAVHPRYEYGRYKLHDGQVVIFARHLSDSVLQLKTNALPLGIDLVDGKYVKGEDLVGLEYRHPFIDRAGKVVPAEYVTLEDGTGLVHTAPGHGVEDYQTGLREGLDVYCPVRADGTYDDTVPEWLRGESIWTANGRVVEKLRESGHLFHDQKFMHSYPHDWRGKKPVIFRATEQWFIGVDKTFEGLAGDAQRPHTLRNIAMDAVTTGVKFYPEWGRNRMRGMLESRPDWCVSRQRSWGLPIPAFFQPDGTPLLTPESVRAVANVFAEKGSDAWYLMEPADLLRDFDAEKAGIDVTTLTKGGDTFDVWFESGSSWNAVLNQGWRDKQAPPPDQSPLPAELYLEGSDQHRGWFQHSLLPAIANTGQPPFKAILTHGFMVDKDGRKMSKSIGNTLNVDELFKQYGADICRWWVASINTDNDIKVDESFFKLAGEEYRKVRNTIRFLLSNLNPNDFVWDDHKYRFEDEDAASPDAWITAELIRLSETVTAAYESFAFRRATEAIFNFCNDTLSAIYLTATKDRLYCDTLDAPRRRRTQTAMFRVATTLIRLLAPILPHTSDEAWRFLEGGSNDDKSAGENGGGACVHLVTFQDVECMKQIPAHPKWPDVIAARQTWMRTLEAFRQDNGIDNPLDLGLIATDPDGLLADFDPTDLADMCGISRFAIGETLAVTNLSDAPRCERSWKRDATVRDRVYEGETVALSDRDAAAVGAI